jgi:hypothetical protein
MQYPKLHADFASPAKNDDACPGGARVVKKGEKKQMNGTAIAAPALSAPVAAKIPGGNPRDTFELHAECLTPQSDDLSDLKNEMIVAFKGTVPTIGLRLWRRARFSDLEVEVYEGAVLQLAVELLEQNPDLHAGDLMKSCVPNPPRVVDINDLAWKDGADPRGWEPYHIPAGFKGGRRFFEKVVQAARDKKGQWLSSTDAHGARMAHAYREKLRYEPASNQWFDFTGWVWRKDDRAVAFSAAKKICRGFVQRTGAGVTEHMVKETLSFAGRDDRIRVAPEDWDVNPYLLNTRAGVVDLRSGVLRSSRPTDLMRKVAGAEPDPTAECPLWKKFLETIFDGDKDLIAFLQRFGGYCLTGDTREQKFLFLYGTGRNGKTTFLEILSGVLAITREREGPIFSCVPRLRSTAKA